MKNQENNLRRECQLVRRKTEKNMYSWKASNESGSRRRTCKILLKAWVKLKTESWPLDLRVLVMLTKAVSLGLKLWLLVLEKLFHYYQYADNNISINYFKIFKRKHLFEKNWKKNRQKLEGIWPLKMKTILDDICVFATFFCPDGILDLRSG